MERGVILMSKEDLKKMLRSAREELLQSISGLDIFFLTEKKIKNWTVKDVLAHVASWQREERLIVEKALREKEPEFFYFLNDAEDFYKWNEKEIEKRRACSLEEILEELSREQELFLQTIDRLSDEDLRKEFQPPWPGRTTIKECILIEVEHEREHAKKIREWRKREGI
jgi:hypothetical protein